jgi:hypothetical protein
MKASDNARSPERNGDTPEERHAEFERENGEWSHRLDEALTELEELAGEGKPDREKAEPPASG